MKPEPQKSYSTKQLSSTLVLEIKSALESIKSYGSVEIYIQNGVVTQITVRNIKKTNGKVNSFKL